MVVIVLLLLQKLCTMGVVFGYYLYFEVRGRERATFFSRKSTGAFTPSVNVFLCGDVVLL